MSWERVRLDTVTESCLGKMLDQEKNKGEYQPYLANLNVRWGYFDLDDLSEMRFEKHEEDRYGLKYGDLVICEGGEPGRCAIWKEQIPNMKIQKALHRVRVNNEMDYRYLFYWFLLAGKTNVLDQYFTGATIKHMPGQKLKQVVIDKPALEIQQRIADILSAYDDLIENNKKQIKLLEEAAQRLYKEWFVDLRFPGYENTKIVDGVPEGWALSSVGNLAQFRRGKTITRNQSIQGNIPVIAGGKEPAYYHNVANTSSPVITISASGNAGFVRMYYQDVWASDCSWLDMSTTEHIYYIYCFLKHRQSDIYSMQKGACQQHINAKEINEFKMIIPDFVILAKFKNTISAYFEKIKVLLEQIEFSKQARDRLLPKLMSGELEV
ncbi:MAG: restriction endonuclease subunit S [Clostridia bacterium]|nr:restriction endonuclease subunit S [Clostridia bacterium]